MYCPSVWRGNHPRHRNACESRQLKRLCSSQRSALEIRQNLKSMLSYLLSEHDMMATSLRMVLPIVLGRLSNRRFQIGLSTYLHARWRADYVALADSINCRRFFERSGIHRPRWHMAYECPRDGPGRATGSGQTGVPPADSGTMQRHHDRVGLLLGVERPVFEGMPSKKTFY